MTHARAVLQTTEEITLYGEDDVGLDDPSWTYEDAPTEVTAFVDVSHLLEEWQ